MREYIEFNNPTGAARVATFLIQARTLPPELRLSFMLSKLQTVQPLPASITGVVSTTGGDSPNDHPDLDEHLLGFLEGIEEQIEEAFEDLSEWVKDWDRDDKSRAGAPQPPVYVGLPATNVTITGVQLPPFGAASMAFRIENRGALPPGSRYTFHVQQIVGGIVVGGSAYVVHIDGNTQPIVIPVIGGEALGWVPSYAAAQIAAREGSLGKR
jgi:hypothetical protein